MSKTFNVALAALRDAVGHDQYQRPHIPIEREREFPDSAADRMTASDVAQVVAPGRVILFSSCGDFDYGEPSNSKAHLLGEVAFIAGKELVLVTRCHCHEREKKAFAIRHGMLYLRLG